MVPPSPNLVAQLYARFLALQSEGRVPADMTFEDYYKVSGISACETEGAS